MEYEDKVLHQPVTKSITEIAQLSPDKIAVIRGEETLSFAKLNARANQFAHFLLKKGIGSGDRVGICLDRTFDFVAVILGIWKIGAIYVPLNRIFPVDRLKTIVIVTDVQLIITDDTSKELFSDESKIPIYCLGESAVQQMISSMPKLEPPEIPLIDLVAAYVFSSGSTGDPKVVQVTHRALSSHAKWNAVQSPFHNDEKCLYKATVSFAISLVELVDPLVNSAPIVLVPEKEIRDFKALADIIEKEKITRFWGVTSVLKAFLNFLEDPVKTLSSIRTFYCTGEAVPVDLALKFKWMFPNATFFHTYGTSEGFEALAYNCAKLNEKMEKNSFRNALRRMLSISHG